MIHIELYGAPRLRAGVPRLTVAGDSVGDAIDAMALACPSLAGHVLHDGLVHPAYKLSVNGERFVSDRSTPLNDGDTLLLLSADVGG
jgi:molybdopterin converting factor small subunit